jgi:hypothetical protein
MDKALPKISDLSPHLFWDCDQKKVSWDGSAKLILERVLHYGTLNDWKILISVYPKSKMSEITLDLIYLDPKALNFISSYLKISPKKFRCYTQRSLNQGHWIY